MAETPNDSAEYEENLPKLPDARHVLAYLPGFAWRVLVPMALITVVLNIPFSERMSGQAAVIGDVIFMLLCAVAFLYFFRWQVSSIHRSVTPEARWLEALIVLGFFFVTVFARAYRIIDLGYPHAFTQPMDLLNSYYYALGVLSTAGDGVLAPLVPVAKMLSMAQIIADLALIGLLVRVLTGAATKAVKRRKNG